MAESLADIRIGDLLEAIADESTAVASGAVAAATAASAAGLIAMSARRASGWDGGSAAAGQSEVLRRRATELIDESAAAFDQAVAELEAGRGPGHDSDAQSDWRLGTALRRAGEAPVEVAGVAADVAALAAEVADCCDESVRPDAVAACLLAESATAIAAHLASVNLLAEEDASGADRARGLAAEAGAARARLLDRKA